MPKNDKAFVNGCARRTNNKVLVITNAPGFLVKIFFYGKTAFWTLKRNRLSSIIRLNEDCSVVVLV